MGFLKTVLGSCLGVFLAIGLIVVIFGAIASASMFSSDQKPDAGILRIDLNNFIPELTENVASGSFSLEAQPKQIGLQEFKALIANAKSDPKIKGISIDVRDTPNGAATLLEVLNTLEDFKKSGKPIFAYIDITSQNGYMVSSVADEIMINPNGEIGIRGYGMMIPFIKDAAEKLGVEFKIFYAGNFKSATESLRRSNISPENRLQSSEFLNERMDIFKGILLANRKLSSVTLDSIMNNLLGRSAEHAKSSGLVDRVGYKSDYEEYLAEKTGLIANDINYISMEDYEASTTLIQKGSYSKKVAVVYLEGDVMDGTNEKGQISDERYVKIFSKIRKDNNIKAVVWRVNSGGGSSFSSDIIWHEVELVKEKGIPVIASFGDYAASGGYYLACGADKIYASPNTLTGSIGVFSILLKTKKLFNDKLGVSFDTVRTHNNSIYLSSTYDLSPKEEQVMTELTEDVYNTFLDKVAQGRHMSKDSVHAVAQGRVWTGKRALSLGLVDAIGNLDQAISYAATTAEIEDYKIVEYPYIKREVWQEILEGFSKSSDDEARIKTYLSGKNKLVAQTVDYLYTLSKMDKVQAKLPFRLEE